jgi:hypothetical protein
MFLAFLYLDFFSKNKLIYIFQKNIIKNKKVESPYYKWFDFANISRNPDNKEKDFSNYINDKDMAEVINRLRKDKLSPEEFKYISDLDSYEILMARKDADHKAELARQKKLAFQRELKAVELERQKAEQERQNTEQERRKAEQERQEKEQERQEKELLQIELIKILLPQGATITTIAGTLKISEEKAKKLVEQIQKN